MYEYVSFIINLNNVLKIVHLTLRDLKLLIKNMYN